MSTSRTQPPWEFLLTASRNTLQSYELSRLCHAANLRKEISSLLDQWLDENTAASLAQWLIRQRELSVLGPEQTPAPEPAVTNSESASDNLLPDRFAPHNGSRRRTKSFTGPALYFCWFLFPFGPCVPHLPYRKRCVLLDSLLWRLDSRLLLLSRRLVSVCSVFVPRAVACCRFTRHLGNYVLAAL
ncbi:MAG TPA: hypothetical protein VGF61_13975 [Candidatus Acidoferrum sp.]